ncbi:site-specific DNA-methyltransferase [Muribaculum intestinale]|uniref:site-specific DNA-methyltransferase n=1 Tax=Muribaculum intestinale TaxID=1796646 RepID=UPI0026235D9E|nr:site-specific DNA-methyltransferase [Muribaculum intestinale]
MNKTELARKIQALEGLSNEEKTALLELIRGHKKYGLVWEEKPEDIEERLREDLPVLVERNDDKVYPIISDNPDAPNHLIIEGDNLAALTELSYTHAGKIDVIYIDPPYNTGNKDFVYNDNYVDKEDCYRHSKWLSFLVKRLRIAKNLLSERGVVFISIDDNEQANLKLVCDEIFGENNFVAIFPRLTTKSGKTPLNYMISHDYVLCYVSSEQDIFTGTPFEDDSYKFSDEYIATRGKYNLKQPLDCNSISYSSSLDYIIEHDGVLYYPGGSKEKYYERKSGKHLPKDYAWRWSKDMFDFGLSQGWIVFKNGRIYTKGYLNAIIERQSNGQYGITYRDKVRKRSTIDFISNEFSNDIAKKQLLSFALSDKFDFPKPFSLISALVQTYKFKSCTVLDFFAGSGSTGQAVLSLNASDGGMRSFILCTNNENGICENITYERNKRIIEGYTKPNGDEVAGLADNNLRYYRTEFLPRERSVKNMRELVQASTGLLCIKNDLYTEAPFGGRKMNPKYARYFEHGNKRMLVIYEERAIPFIAGIIRTMPDGEKIKVYVSSHGSYAYDDEFAEVEDRVELCALPQAIYDAYQNVLPQRKPKFLVEELVEDIETAEEAEETTEGLFGLDYEKGGEE